MKLLIILGLFALAYCSKRCAIPCPRNYRPVCGSDGRTYPTECVMRAMSCEQGQAVIAVRQGKCPDDAAARCLIPCTKIFRPVCGSDGKMHANECTLRVASCVARKAITMTRKANLRGDDCTKCHTMCPAIYAPVCSHDGKTYDTECHMRAAACKAQSPIVAVYNGSCRE